MKTVITALAATFALTLIGACAPMDAPAKKADGGNTNPGVDCTVDCAPPSGLRTIDSTGSSVEPVTRANSCPECPRCTVDNDCVVGQYCQVGLPPQGNYCTADKCQLPKPALAPADSCHYYECTDRQVGWVKKALAAGAQCSDGSACTSNDACNATGQCVGEAKVCAASDSCHAAGVCDPTSGNCSNPVLANNTACDDGNACTQASSCQAGVCVGSNPVVCTAQDNCHAAGVCDPTSGACSNPVLANNTACDDGDACTQASSCQAGVCVGSNPVVCTASDSCHVAGTCEPLTGLCNNPVKPNGASCTDGNSCTQTDSCVAGVCVGSNPVMCTNQVEEACVPATGTCDYFTCLDDAQCDAQFGAALQDDLVAQGKSPALLKMGCQTLGQNPPMPRPGTCSPFEPSQADPTKVSLIELVCNDGFDGDLDGVVDCDDAQCQGTAACQAPCTRNSDCPPGRVCGAGTCVAAPAEVCNNSLDDDRNGAVDCADRACSALPVCAPPAQTCPQVPCAAGQQCVNGACQAPPPPSGQLSLVANIRGGVPANATRSCIWVECRNGTSPINWTRYPQQSATQCGPASDASRSLTFPNFSIVGKCKAVVEWFNDANPANEVNVGWSPQVATTCFSWSLLNNGASCVGAATGVVGRDNGENGMQWVFTDTDPSGSAPGLTYP